MLASSMLVGLFAGSFVLCCVVGSFVSFRGQEVARTVSPGGDLEALVVEWGGGATAHPSHDVYLLPAGGRIRGLPVAEFYGAKLEPMTWGVVCRWTSEQSLVLEYATARRSKLWMPSVFVASREVVVELAPGR